MTNRKTPKMIVQRKMITIWGKAKDKWKTLGTGGDLRGRKPPKQTTHEAKQRPCGREVKTKGEPVKWPLQVQQ